MKYILILVLSCVGFSAHAQKSCEEKTKSLEAAGVNMDALKMAATFVDSSDIQSRYVLLAEIGTGKANSPNDGKFDVDGGQGHFFLVDLKEGTATKFPMTHGVPSTSNISAKEYTYPGAQKIVTSLDYTKDSYFEKYHRLDARPLSGGLKKSLAKANANQHLLQCSEKHVRDAGSKTDLCISPEAMKLVRSSLLTEKREFEASGSRDLARPEVVMFTYPKDGAKKYLNGLKAVSTARDICNVYERGTNSVNPPAVGGGAGPGRG